MQECEHLDAQDCLAVFRDRFELPESLIYLDGNSLGPPLKATSARIAQVLSSFLLCSLCTSCQCFHDGSNHLCVKQVIRNEWGQDLIGSWNRHGWYNAPQRVGAKIARIIAALPDEVVVADSTSINLFKVAAAALTLRPERRVILSGMHACMQTLLDDLVRGRMHAVLLSAGTLLLSGLSVLRAEEGMFPTDLYMLEGLMWQLGKGHSLRLVEPGSIPAAIDESVALVLLQHVSYRSGAVHSMRALTQAAHARFGTLKAVRLREMPAHAGGPYRFLLYSLQGCTHHLGPRAQCGHVGRAVRLL
jgi:kynureninase